MCAENRYLRRDLEPVGGGDSREESTGSISLLGRGVIFLVRGYQKLLSPLLGQNCRFYPSCSEYFIRAVKKYGFWRGGLKGVWRVCRCHPFHPGGVDLP